MQFLASLVYTCIRMKKIIFHHSRSGNICSMSPKRLHVSSLPVARDSVRKESEIPGCHLSHTVSQGNGPWRAQRPASPSDAALMVYHLHGEALSTATDFQAGFAAQLMTFLWLSEKARRGLLEPRMAGFVPATEKVVQKKSLSPDRARDVIMSISCLELLNCFPLDFSCSTGLTEDLGTRIPF
ncbi:uncharacterized protein LOC103660007 isoform X5 [Ursus maritimus]|uniref:Uncharacterized protein LOC103660007 isoform X5 n=1 Tax=Ursus maritimus TaxID=29073 RepID=A0A8M1GU70_URSMA|nr:uncharacterized protein LOC103660007 isoform X5 [Ursus maritimus]